MKILGIVGGPRGTHEPGVCLIEDGVTRFVFLEERHNRFKNAISCFPQRSLIHLFKKENVDMHSIDCVAHPGITYDDMKLRWPMYLEHNFGFKAKHQVPVHHQLAHAASSFFYSDLEEALVLSMDGVGDRSSGVVAVGQGHKLHLKEEITPNQSIGFYWNILCQFIGYEPLEEAYKTMGLASYGKPRFDFSSILDFRDGKIQFDHSYVLDKWKFVSKHPLELYFSEKLPEFFKEKPRKILEPLREIDKDIAASAQIHLQNVMAKMIRHYLKEHKQKNLSLSGGVFLNSRMVGVLDQILDVNKIFVGPCPSDGGLALGAAMMAHAELTGTRPEPIRTPFMGAQYNEDEILKAVHFSGLPHKPYNKTEVATHLSQNKVIGFFNGRAEYGPRSLGHRSILASPRTAEMKDTVNKKIKFREEYRPFAPAVRDVDFDQYFNRGKGDYTYMSFTIDSKPKAHKEAPAIVHIDGTSRVQEVKPDNKQFYDLLGEFGKVTGTPVLMNTSFNLKGEPIVDSPTDAIRTFISSGLDHLVMENMVISKP